MRAHALYDLSRTRVGSRERTRTCGGEQATEVVVRRRQSRRRREAVHRARRVLRSGFTIVSCDRALDTSGKWYISIRIVILTIYGRCDKSKGDLGETVSDLRDYVAFLILFYHLEHACAKLLPPLLFLLLLLLVSLPTAVRRLVGVFPRENSLTHLLN